MFINYLALKDLLIPFLKRLPTDKLALLNPELEKIKFGTSSPDTILYRGYPQTKRIHDLKFRFMNSESPQNVEILLNETQGCTGFECTDEHKLFFDWGSIKDNSINFLNHFNNLTRLYLYNLNIKKNDTKTYFLFKSLTQINSLIKLKIFTFKGKVSETEQSSVDDNQETLEFPNIQTVKGNISLVQKYYHTIFPNANIILYLEEKGEQYLEEFLTRHQKIVAITYSPWPYDLDLHCFSWNIFNSVNFRKVVRIAGSTLKSIDFGICTELTDEDFNELTHCPNLERFRCLDEINDYNPIKRLTKSAVANLFKAVSFKSIGWIWVPCDDRAIKKLMKKSHSSLTELEIKACPITDASLQRIAKFGRKLTTLKLTECEHLTVNALTNLVRETPNLESCMLGGGKGFLKEHVALISQRLPNIRSIKLEIDISKGNFIKEAREYFPKYVEVKFVNEEQEVLTEESTPYPDSIFWSNVDQATQEVVNNIQNIVKHALKNHEIIFTPQSKHEEVFAIAKAEFEQFAATHIAEDKLNDFNKLSGRVKNVVILLGCRSVKELTAGPMRPFLDLMVTFTSKTTLTSFFYTQSLSSGRRLTGELEKTISESILDQILNTSLVSLFR